jgi:hypothetical protein
VIYERLSAQRPQGAYYFFLEKKVTKIQDSKNASFAASRFLIGTNQAEPRLRLFAPLSHPLIPASAKR